MIAIILRVVSSLSLLSLLILSACGGGGDGPNPAVDTLAPSVPENLSAVKSASQIGLSWSESSDNVDVAGYKIFRDGQFLQSTETTAALDNVLNGSTEHCYAASAFDGSGNESAQSTPLCTEAPSFFINERCSVYPANATGLIGIAFRGPIMPVCNEGEPCDSPFSAQFRIEKDSVTVGVFRSNAEGCFAVQVPAGNYIVVPDADAPILSPGSQTKEVTVGQNGWTGVELMFDTGIR